MKLIINIEGISDDAAKRGLSAAMKIFTDAGMTPLTAREGMYALEAWDDMGLPEEGEDAIADEDAKAANTWMEACEAAIAEACADWPMEKRIDIDEPLEIVMTPADRARYYG